MPFVPGSPTSLLSVLHPNLESEPSVIKHMGIQRLFVGLYKPSSESGVKLSLIIKEGRAGGLQIFGPMEDIQQIRFHKLLWNASFNPISILAGNRDSLQLLANEKTASLIQETMQEVQGLSLKVLGAPFPSDLDTIDQLLERTRAIGGYKPSMLVDWEVGRELETEAILGNAIKVANGVNFDVPILKTIYSLLTLKADRSLGLQ
jgi:2-dehydropantoate 2-reductase